ncbi:hypothetical protein HYH03_016504 [Edaphochlamys debaryana]|uniref:F-box domain-containing protein n=1 Tax=Edaphochlamys debaryana TaxID=47281 RepID=A0A836BQ18_9CHLO|nr:hypothetical protein HYH03_016504 [Edaphochlamys debaryana]|eukprot:KAG2484675.1 hypothetical protein HYH03_016504 [Edaphochlamys debaryana]
MDSLHSLKAHARTASSPLGGLRELPADVWHTIIAECGSGPELHGARLASKQLCRIVDAHAPKLSTSLSHDSAAFWASGALAKWPQCRSFSLHWDAYDVRYEAVGALLPLPFSSVPPSARQGIEELHITATFYGRVQDWDAVNWDDIASDDSDFYVPSENFDEETMQLPAQPLADLLRLLPNLHTLRLPSCAPYAEDHPETAAALSALAGLAHLRDLTLPSYTLAALSGLQHLTRLEVRALGFDEVGGGMGLNSDDVLTDDGVQWICSLRKLEHLELDARRMYVVTDTHVQQILASLPNLERVVLHGLTSPARDDENIYEDELRDLGGATFDLVLSDGYLSSVTLTKPRQRGCLGCNEVALGLISRLARTVLLPRVAPAPGPRVKVLRLDCALGFYLADSGGEWLEPLRELVERCEAVEVQRLYAWERRASAEGVEETVRLLGKPEILDLSCVEVRMRGPHEPSALEIGPADDGAEGADAAEEEGRLDGLNSAQRAAAAQAVWDNKAGGTELQRLRRLLALVRY